MTESRDFEKEPVSREELEKLYTLSQNKLKALAAQIVLNLMNYSERPTKEQLELQKQLQKQNSFLEKILYPKQGKKVSDLDTSELKNILKDIMSSKGTVGEIVRETKI